MPTLPSVLRPHSWTSRRSAPGLSDEVVWHVAPGAASAKLQKNDIRRNLTVPAPFGRSWLATSQRASEFGPALAEHVKRSWPWGVKKFSLLRD